MLRDEVRRAQSTPRRAAESVRDLWRGQVLARLARRGPVSDSFCYKPVPLAIGSRDRADALLRGQFVFDGRAARAERGDPWRIAPPSDAWAAALHGFGWLRHLRAADGPAARDFARRVVDGWLHRYASGGGFPWRPAIAGDRATAWCMNAAMLTENAEPVYRGEVLRALGTQGRYLLSAGKGEAEPMDRLRAATGALYAALCLESERARLPEAAALALKAAQAAAAPDGGARSRNPSDLLDRLERLAQIRRDLEDAGEGALAAPFNKPIERAAAALRALRHGDGGLGLFHGGRAEGGARVDRALSESRTAGVAPDPGSQGGFLRMSCGRSVAILDAGPAPQGAAARFGHCAPLALEFSSGRRRVLVNCGSGAHLDAEWEIACRRSAAHSTLTLAESSPGRFEATGAGAPPRLRRLTEGPLPVACTREEDASGCWALAAHDGYAARYGLLHYRRLFLGADGGDLRGEDTLTLSRSGGRALRDARARLKTPDGPGFAVRFHLHPDAQVEREGAGAALLLPNGERWRFMQSGGRLALEDSVFLASAQSPVQSTQIVIHGALKDDSAQVKWALKRLDGPEDGRDLTPGPAAPGEGDEGEARAEDPPPFSDED